ncbi:DUF3443 family protein [Trinickia diaoshuihuensis]|uniref:DUF3443 family protein n=1 Tax=Trinickia diaoshuihuensis TaxID=2292265 RepID=UPI001F07447A|nr:DUF3443 family protein [Trinickia diaoshuihuensis]
MGINGKWLCAAGLAAVIALAAGCGGGGGGSGGTSSSSTSSTSSSASNGPSSPSVSVGGAAANNQVSVTVSSGLNLSLKAPNMPMVSVTLCAPGTNNCATIDNVQLDTGSYGLRLTKDAVGGFLSSLPAQTLPGGKTLAECAGFADGFSWGSVRLADVKLGGETASSLPIQILGDISQSAFGSGAGATSSNCASGTLNDTPSRLSANGILGVGTARYDCGSNCVTNVTNGMYYSCFSTPSCTDTTVPLNQQVANPVRSFAADNNGISLIMPAVPATGAATATGLLTFGIGTQTNNAEPTSGLLRFQTDIFGDVPKAMMTSIGSQTYAFFDSGSNGLFFPDNTITQCSGSSFFCPASTISRVATLTGYNTTSSPVTLNIANASTLITSGGFAFNDLGAYLDPATSGIFAIDIGMPFFYGRTLYFDYDPVGMGNQGFASNTYVSF